MAPASPRAIPNRAQTLDVLRLMGRYRPLLMLPGDESPLTEAWEIQDRLDDLIELIIDGGYCGTTPTTEIRPPTSAPLRMPQGVLLLCAWPWTRP